MHVFGYDKLTEGGNRRFRIEASSSDVSGTASPLTEGGTRGVPPGRGCTRSADPPDPSLSAPVKGEGVGTVDSAVAKDAAKATIPPGPGACASRRSAPPPT